MTKAERDTLRALCASATPGPWRHFNVDDDSSMNVYGVMTGTHEPDYECLDSSKFKGVGNVIALTLFQSPRVADHESAKFSDNARLIASARDSIPDLLNTLDEKDALIADLIAFTSMNRRDMTNLEYGARLAALKARAAQ